jgi:hypothetical protein
MPIKKTIIYPSFLECCQFTTDSFWKNIFEDLSYGKTPIGAYIRNGVLYCKKKKKDFRYRIDFTDPKRLYHTIYKFFNSKLNLMTIEKKDEAKKCFNQAKEIIKKKYENWSTIKRKNVKNILIEKFIINSKGDEFSVEDCEKVISMIQILMVSKTILNTDIIYADGSIEDIKGFSYSKMNGKINIRLRNLPDRDVSSSSCSLTETELMSDKWGKFIKDISQ